MIFVFGENTSLVVSLRNETKVAVAKSHCGCSVLIRESDPFGARNNCRVAVGAEQVISSGKVILCRPCIILMYDIMRTRVQRQKQAVAVRNKGFFLLTAAFVTFVACMNIYCTRRTYTAIILFPVTLIALLHLFSLIVANELLIKRKEKFPAKFSFHNRDDFLPAL